MTDTKELGQVAFEAFFRNPNVYGSWPNARTSEREDYARIERAVLEHHGVERLRVDLAGCRDSIVRLTERGRYASGQLEAAMSKVERLEAELTQLRERAEKAEARAELIRAKFVLADDTAVAARERNALLERVVEAGDKMRDAFVGGYTSVFPQSARDYDVCRAALDAAKPKDSTSAESTGPHDKADVPNAVAPGVETTGQSDAGTGRITASPEVPSPLAGDAMGPAAVAPRRHSGHLYLNALAERVARLEGSVNGLHVAESLKELFARVLRLEQAQRLREPVSPAFCGKAVDDYMCAQPLGHSGECVDWMGCKAKRDGGEK